MDDETYYRRRAREEEKAARIATCREVRDRHEEFASAYHLRARLLLCPADEPSDTLTRPAAEIPHELA